jgi:hypothetical protein
MAKPAKTKIRAVHNALRLLTTLSRKQNDIAGYDAAKYKRDDVTAACVVIILAV